MSKLCVAFDTSNYTTSVALFDGSEHRTAERLLPVPDGELGLRQSDAVFHHTRALPELMESLGAVERFPDAVGASYAPREAEGSYMPCFLVGLGQARSIAALSGIPCLRFSHQQGHIAAAAWSSGHIELLEKPLLAWHLSGGTSELLLVRPNGASVSCEIVGGTTDISAGQLIDRTGLALGLKFPAGKALDTLACQNDSDKRFNVKVQDSRFSLSGMQNKTTEMIKAGDPAADVASFALCTVADAVLQATKQALRRFGDMPVMCSGGVSASSKLRSRLSDFIFSQPRYASDNALGIAVLTWRKINE